MLGIFLSFFTFYAVRSNTMCGLHTQLFGGARQPSPTQESKSDRVPMCPPPPKPSWATPHNPPPPPRVSGDNGGWYAVGPFQALSLRIPREVGFRKQSNMYSPTKGKETKRKQRRGMCTPGSLGNVKLGLIWA